jgi:hypothetical protein
MTGFLITAGRQRKMKNLHTGLSKVSENLVARLTLVFFEGSNFYGGLGTQEIWNVRTVDKQKENNSDATIQDNRMQ